MENSFLDIKGLDTFLENLKTIFPLKSDIESSINAIQKELARISSVVDSTLECDGETPTLRAVSPMFIDGGTPATRSVDVGVDYDGGTPETRAASA